MSGPDGGEQVPGSLEPHQEATAVHATAAQPLERGFRLLLLRQFHLQGRPPDFALIDQQLLRTPQRAGRHSLFFACTFRPEVMAWLNEQLGRASARDDGDQPRRNPRWPSTSWHGEEGLWPDGTRTTEWSVDVIFPEEAAATAFKQHWREQLNGRP